MPKQPAPLKGISAKSREIASMAGEAIGQAALQVTHLALKRARAAVASADQAIYPAKRGKAKKKAAARTKAVAKKRGKAITKKIAKKAVKSVHSAAKEAAGKSR
jgi:hypothetical protein